MCSHTLLAQSNLFLTGPYFLGFTKEGAHNLSTQFLQLQDGPASVVLNSVGPLAPPFVHHPLLPSVPPAAE